MAPEILRDWDWYWDKDRDKYYSKNYYTGEWLRVKREYKYLIIIYSLENILISLPLLYT